MYFPAYSLACGRYLDRLVEDQGYAATVIET